MLETPFMRFLLAAACIVIIVAGIKALSAALIIVLFAILIAQCIHPLTVWLRTKKISSLFAVIITVLVVIIVGVAVISVLAGAVNGIRSKLPEYSQRIGELTEGLVA